VAKKRIGRQEPTQSLILPNRKSLYKRAIEAYEKTGRKAQKWQSALLKPIMAVNTRGEWVHSQFGYSVPRQNGKNEVVAMRELDGILNKERILHTAHRTTTSHAAWERLCGFLDEAGIEYKSIKAKGSENIRLDGGGRIEFRTRSTLGGLGESYDLLVIDEAQEYTAEQATALKYVIAASPNPQTIYCGTPPTPLSSGTVFMNLRNDALAGRTQDTGWAEWGVEEESDVNDRELWYHCNPALGIRITERTIQTEISSDTVDFNIQRLGLWLKYNQKSAITKSEWEELKVQTLPKLTGKLYVGIKYGNDGNNVAASIAVKTADGKIFVEALDCQSIRNGNDWIVAFLTQADVGAVVIDGASGQTILAKEMKDARLKEPVLPTVREIITANSSFEKAIFQKTIQHKGQPSLTEVVTNSDKRTIGTNGGFGYRSQLEDYDIALMDSVLLAHWACLEAKPIVKQKIRY
jgi:phage terminase large subunit-like protein